MTDECDELLKKLARLPDYPAIRDVAQALWGVGEVRGAAVMIGSGFSRNADLAVGNSVKPPLWGDFTRRLAADLYPSDPGQALGDPLRLAEEYRSALGQPALDALIRELVADRKWLPSALHRTLMRLPWADVLTTNWDTLLERAAAEDHERGYEIVETVDAISRTRAPRIVKLHGSLPSHTPFIFAEEDFRTYPQKFAPFVNLAQQVMLENELVLLGFSGEDPNFLRWTGWVRDQLGASARRIRLVGVLNLTPSRRRLLEAQNITPIDLAPAIDTIDPADCHGVATKIFLEALLAARPPEPRDWTLERSRTSAQKDAKEIVAQWIRERELYPGWLIAPPTQRLLLGMMTGPLMSQLELAFPTLDIRFQAQLATELAWRCKIGMESLPGWIDRALSALCADPASGLGRSDRFDLHLAQATGARRRRDDLLFGTALAAAEAEAQTADEKAAIAYEQCLFARDRLDYAAIAKLLPALSGNDPAWTLRKSAMLAFLREKRRAADAAYDALLEIRARRARDRRSIWLLSREAWAHHVVRNSTYDLAKKVPVEIHQWPERYRAASCDPWEEFTHFDHELTRVNESLSRIDRIEPSFVPGVRRTIRERPQTREIGGTPFHELLAIADEAGFARMPNLDVIDSRLQMGALLLGEHAADVWNILLAIREWDRGLINQRFNRVAVARLDPGLAKEIVARLKDAIDYGRGRLVATETDEDEKQRSMNWTERLRTLLELLSRFAIRLAPDEAIGQFRWACAFATDAGWQHWWLFETWGHLLDRTLDAVPPSRRGELAPEILNLPQPGEREMLGIDRFWPILAQRLEDKAITLHRQDPAWRNRISAIIELLRSSNEVARSRALITLYILFKKGVLTQEEQALTAKGIWDRVLPRNGYPTNPNLMPHIFLDLPEPEPGVAAEAFGRIVVARIIAGQSTASDEQALAGAARARHAYTLPLQDAQKLASTLLAWRPPTPVADRGWGRDPEMGDKAHAIMAVLDSAIIPVLADEALTDAFVDEMIASIGAIGPDMVEALPALVRRRPGLGDKIFAVMRRALASRSADIVYPASRGLFRWIKAAEAQEMKIPSAMPSEIAAIVGNRREPALRPALSLAAHLVGFGLMSRTDQDRLGEALDVLAAETAYDNQDRGGLSEDTLTLVRANCVRLANALSQNGVSSSAIDQWLMSVPSDPIPEVRFALDTLEE